MQAPERRPRISRSHLFATAMAAAMWIVPSGIAQAASCTEHVLEAEQEPLPEGVYYHHQLVGCDVVLPSGETLGQVSAVQGDGQATRLVVRSMRSEVLIPLAEEICAVDVAAKRIVVTPPEGLLEVNGEWRA